ncbi:MAG: aldose 1-epimerase [Bryobacterales bacterium]|nr:aldose 1-epimerase [Bryobacterales bacterium]
MRPTLLAALLGTLPLMSQTTNYSAERVAGQGIEVLSLRDARARTEVRIAPKTGNNAYSMKVNGQEILYFPHSSAAEWAARPGMAGNPFLAPWANRIDGESYWVNGKQYHLNPGLGAYRKDGNGLPIHGLLLYAHDWEVVSLKASEADGAVATSRLVPHRDPARAAQFPFAHTIEMTYRLRDGVLDVQTAIVNESSAPLPVMIGYHTYYQIPGVPRDQWKVHVAARQHVTLGPKLTPTGETTSVSLADPAPLAGTQLDDVFTGLEQDASGWTPFWVEGGGKRITVEYGPRYTVSVIYAPPGREFICFEPMTGVTNQFNLAHEGKFAGLLQSVAPGARWVESFRVKTSGF